MAFSEALARQLALPQGSVGRLLGSAMDLANRVPVRLSVDLLVPQGGEKVLDVGCGTGAAIRQVLDRAPVIATGIDPSAAMIRSARRKLGNRARLLNCDIEEAPFSAGEFDAALAINVLYFCDADGAMLRSVHSVLRPGGRLVAFVSHRDAMEGWAFTRAGLHRLFDEEQLFGALSDAGFAPDGINMQTGPVARGIAGIWAVAFRQA